MTAAPEPALLVEEASEKPLSSGVLMFIQQTSLLSSHLPVVCSLTAATLRLVKGKSDRIVPFPKLSCGSSFRPVLEHIGHF